MLVQTPWFDRKFDRIEDDGLFNNIIERLDGTAVRLQMKLYSIDNQLLTYSVNEKWSIKEEIGHLCDLEPLWYERVLDVLNGEAMMCSADLENKKTHEANYNTAPIENLLGLFATERDYLIERLRNIPPEDLPRKCLHPRLKTPMRIIDLAFFIAEHDDHHLTRITSILQA